MYVVHVHRLAVGPTVFSTVTLIRTKMRDVQVHSDFIFVFGFVLFCCFAFSTQARQIPDSGVSRDAFPQTQERVGAALLFTGARVLVSRQPVYLRRCPVTFFSASIKGGNAPCISSSVKAATRTAGGVCAVFGLVATLGTRPATRRAARVTLSVAALRRCAFFPTDANGTGGEAEATLNHTLTQQEGDSPPINPGGVS